MIMNWILSKKPDPEAAPAGGSPSAVDYVDWLLGHMLRTSQTRLAIDSTAPLPGATGVAPPDAPPCVPPATAVINRLKLLSGLNPVNFPRPTEGRFERVRGSYVLTITARFQDGAASTCTLNLRVRGQAT